MRALVPLCLVLVATLAGCYNVTLRAVPDPAFAGKVYHALLVRSFGTYVVEHAMMLEDAYADQLGRHGFDGTVHRYYALFPPTRKPDAKAIAKVVRERGIDGVLELHATSVGSSGSYVPRSSTTTSTTDRAKGATRIETRTTTSQSGGYTVYTAYVNLEVQLRDVEKAEVAWVGYTFGSGGTPADYQPLMDTQADRVVARLLSDGLIRRR